MTAPDTDPRRGQLNWQDLEIGRPLELGKAGRKLDQLSGLPG